MDPPFYKIHIYKFYKLNDISFIFLFLLLLETYFVVCFNRAKKKVLKICTRSVIGRSSLSSNNDEEEELLLLVFINNLVPIIYTLEKLRMIHIIYILIKQSLPFNIKINDTIIQHLTIHKSISIFSYNSNTARCRGWIMEQSNSMKNTFHN